MSKKNIEERLIGLLADTYILALKTQNYHWNVTGAHFSSYHSFLESQYKSLYEAGDKIAERIRTIGFPAPGSYVVFSKHTKIKEETGVPNASQMIKNLINDHDGIIDRLDESLKIIQTAGDEGTTDFLISRLQDHEKIRWMLQATISA